MAFSPFSRKQFIKTIDTSESPKMGSFKVTTSGELIYIRALVYIEDATALGGTEQIRLKVFADADHNVTLYTSSYSDLADIADIGTVTQNWIGLVRFDFAGQNLNKNITYYLGAELNNYTRNGDSFYIGLSHDFPFARYSTELNNFYNTNLAFEIFTKS